MDRKERANATALPVAAEQGTVLPLAATLQAVDGYHLSGFCWRDSRDGRGTRPVVIINPATSVRCRYYFRFAAFLFKHGFDVITYDYRGIGESRPGRLRDFEACWMDWGCLDFEGVLRHVEKSFPSQPIHVVGHSAGGFVLGLAASNRLIQRIFTMGAQFAYWRDYAADKRGRLLAKWHLAMPLLTFLFGYFPGKRLGWMEDTPRGVVRDWAFSRARFEDTWRGRSSARYPDKHALVRRFEAITAPTLAISVTDDEFGTVPAVERLLAYFIHSPRLHLRITPESIGEAAIGHFGFFNSRFEHRLWDLPLHWLRFGRLPDRYPGVLTPQTDELREVSRG